MGARSRGFVEGRPCDRIAEPEADLKQCLKQPIKWALDTLPPLSCFAKDRVALVGDAVCFQPPSL